ncbi:MAG TPA: insulinase family protein, partial [bacterium]|nr:insulinase family protein [bacterium]
PPDALPARQVLIADRDLADVRLVVGCRIAPETPAGSAARDLLREVLNEDLFARLREETGMAYSVDAEQNVWRGGSAVLFVNAAVRADRAAEAVRVILDRIAALRDRAVPPSRLEKARWTLARRTWVRNQSAEETLSTLVDAVREGVPLGGFSDYGRDLSASSEEDLAELVAPCAGHEIVSAIGPAPLLEPAFAARALSAERMSPPPSVTIPAVASTHRAAPPLTRPRPAQIRLPWHLGPNLD